VDEDEVLAAGLAHDARVALVLRDVLADGPPHALEDLGGAREVDAGEIGLVHDRVADLTPRGRA
jgi:hypothetical protein